MPESILFLCGQDSPIEREFLEELLRYYQNGTKIFGVFSNISQVESLVEVLDGYLLEKGLARDGLGLVPVSTNTEVEMDGEYFFMFHGSFHLWTLPCPMERKIMTAEEIGSVLPLLEKYALTFDVAQFCAIEEALGHNILVEGEGGTGKTRVLLARFLFLWKNTELEQEFFLETTKIVVFHDSLKEKYSEWIKTELETCFLLTGDEKYSRMLSAVHKIQFYTVDELLWESMLESGQKLEIVDGFGLLKEIISQTTQLFIVENPSKMSEMQALHLTFDQIEAHIFKLVQQIYVEKVNLQLITASSFGGVKKNDPYGGMKLFYHESAMKIAHLWKDTLISMGKIHSIQVVSHFLTIERHSGQEQLLFIDDFHLATDGEIEALFTYVKKKETWLFICQNRGENKFSQSKNSFFTRFFSGNQVNSWYFFLLKHQYRLDKNLYQIFQKIFLAANETMALKNYNEYLWEYPSKFYHMSKIYGDDEGIIGIYDEIKRLERRFYYEEENGMKKKGHLKTVGIVVESKEKAREIVRSFARYGEKIQSFSEENVVVSDLNCLIRAILYYDDAGALYQLLESNFFAITVPKSNLYGISEDNGHEKGVISYLRVLLREEFNKKEDKMTWDCFQEKLFSNLAYLKYFYELMTPWGKCSKTEKKKYQNDLECLFSYVEKQGILSLIELKKAIEANKIPFLSEKILEENDMYLYCLTKEECVGREFGHILLLSSEESTTKDVWAFIHGNSSLLAYEFPLEWENEVLSSEFSSEIKERLVENQVALLHQLMSKCQYSFSWLSIQGRPKTIEEKILEKGLDTYGL